MKNVFMAIAMDLGDPASPFGSVHPRDKQDVGYRLVLAGRAIAYHDESVYYTGPIAVNAKTVDFTDHIVIMYRNIKDHKLEIRSHSGFEIGCKKSIYLSWIETAVYKATDNSVVVMNTCGTYWRPTQVRYSWRDDPCVFKKCAVYSGDLPSPPFILPITTDNWYS